MPACTHAHCGGEQPREFPVVERLRVALQAFNRCLLCSCVRARGNVMGSTVKGSGQHLSQTGEQDMNFPKQFRDGGFCRPRFCAARCLHLTCELLTFKVKNIFSVQLRCWSRAVQKIFEYLAALGTVAFPVSWFYPQGVKSTRLQSFLF